MSTSDTTVTGSLWVTGATAINKSGTGITEIGSTEVGSRTVIGNTSMIGGVDINTSGIGITMIGSTEFGARTILGNTYGIAGASRGNKAPVYTAEKYEAYRLRQARKHGLVDG